MEKNKNIEEAKLTLAERQKLHNETQRRQMLAQDGSDYIIPETFLVKPQGLAGCEKRIENLIKYGY